MTRILSDKANRIYLALIVIGVLITSVTFVYYGFHLGIKPCTGLPSDAANCGDADLGGVPFLLIGIPIALLGILSLCLSLIWHRIKRSR